jgi:hypothetical protein
MKSAKSALQITVVFFGFCAGASSAFAQSPQSDAEAELRATLAERHKASLAGDSEKIAASMTDDYLQTDIAGFVQDKPTWLRQYFIPLAELIKAGKFRWEKYDEQDVRIRIHGDSAIVIGTLEAKGVGARMDMTTHSWMADSTAAFSGTLHFTRVYVRQNGKWMIAALQNSIVPPAPSPKQS